jgi:uncharacterized protein YcbX
MPPLEMGEWRIFPEGRSDIAREFADQQTDRAQSWLSDFKSQHAGAAWDEVIASLVERIAELTIAYSAHKEDVAGPIDVVEVKTSGIRWFHKKENCPN